MTRPVRIGILDSGVNRAHPHVGRVVDGITLRADGVFSGYEDTLGHGTAVAALIHHQHPQADLVAVRIFEGKLATTLSTVIRAIDWCLDHHIDVINLSLGTLNGAHRGAFEQAIEKTRAAGAVIVSALEINGTAALPGSLPGVIGVSEPDAGAEDYQVYQRYGKPVFTAPPFPRDIPGVPRERNLQGVSFAVARISARVAHAWTRMHDAPGGHRPWTEYFADQYGMDAAWFEAPGAAAMSAGRCGDAAYSDAAAISTD